MTTVLVLAEQDADGLLDSSLRAMTFARGLGEGGALAVAVAGEPQAPAALASTAGEYGAAQLFVMALSGYAPLAWARALHTLAASLGADVVVAPGTDHGNEIMAHLGAINGEEMVANCFAGERMGSGSWQLSRHRWGGSLFEDARLDAKQALLTVATDAVAPEPAPASWPHSGPAEVHEYEPELSGGDEAVVASESREQAGGVSLANARVVVSGGRGVGGAEGFSVIEELAANLGGAVGVSRAVTSLGWRPHSEQVGQTGTRVTPDLYLACGISGAIQHLAGCQSAKTMIAINTDPDAPIMNRADYAVIGDVNEILPVLLAALRARSQPC